MKTLTATSLRNAPSRPFRVSAAALGCALTITGGSFAAEPAKDLADLSLEELMNESVTSVSKKETRLGDAPSAISLITAEDIARSGLDSLPELLRLVPGLSVARIHGNEWSVTARGFTGQYANKLLVLVDGRSVYSPMFGGVYWNAQDMLLQDLDRIEVIRGPGATLWGANAVNGVINITTKSAKETQGGLVSVDVGTEDRVAASVRYGGQLAPNLFYRVYARHFDRKGFVPGMHGAAPADDWEMTRLGTRLDWEPAPEDRLSLQAEYYRGDVGEHFGNVALTEPFDRPEDLVRRNSGGHLLGQWDRRISPVSNLTVQAYYDWFQQGDGDTMEMRDTFDLDLHHRFPIGSRQDVVWGFDFRYTSDRLSPSFYLTFDPEREHERLYSVFLQDEITVVPDRLKLTLGSKFEHNDSTGWELQPGIRALWQPAANHTLWASISRAVRTPARYDRNSRLNASAFQPPSSPPFLVSLIGNPDAAAEELTAYEVGYRLKPSRRLSFDVAAFYNRYQGILGYVSGPVEFEENPAPPHLLLPLRFENRLVGETYGGEFLTQWRVTDRWRLVFGYANIRMRLGPEQTTNEETPENQFQIHSYLDLPHHLQWSAAVYRIGSLVAPRDNDRASIDAYTRLDLGLTWRPAESLEIAVWGQNLGDRRHAEFGSFKTATLTQVPRSVRGEITWRF